MFGYSDSMKSRIFSSDHVLWSRERFLDGIVPENLVSCSHLVVSFVHKDLHLKDGFQIFSVNQVKVSFKGVWICKKESIFILATKQCKL